MKRTTGRTSKIEKTQKDANTMKAGLYVDQDVGEMKYGVSK